MVQLVVTVWRIPYNPDERDTLATEDNIDKQALLDALQHPLRRQILRIFVERGERLSPLDLSQLTKRSLSDISYHVRVLADLGTLRLGHTKARRGALAHFYDSASIVRETRWVRETLDLPASG